MIPSNISHTRSALIKGQNILDNVLLIHEIVRGYGRASGPLHTVIKIDIMKAYDTLNWEFLLSTMGLLGFPNNFIKLVTSCVTTVSFSVNLNRSLVGYFCNKNGLRQEDPISP